MRALRDRFECAGYEFELFHSTTTTNGTAENGPLRDCYVIVTTSATTATAAAAASCSSTHVGRSGATRRSESLSLGARSTALLGETSSEQLSCCHHQASCSSECPGSRCSRRPRRAVDIRRVETATHFGTSFGAKVAFGQSVATRRANAGRRGESGRTAAAARGA